MSEIIDQAVTELSEKIGTFDGSVKFVIEDEGSVMVDDAGVRAAEEEAECTMTADAETFKGILDGSVNPTSAFMSGKLRVDGDMSQAMRLGQQLS